MCHEQTSLDNHAAYRDEVDDLLNPAVIVLGGTLAQAHEQLLAGVREVIYQRSLPLATRHLRIALSTLDDRAASPVRP